MNFLQVLASFRTAIAELQEKREIPEASDDQKTAIDILVNALKQRFEPFPIATQIASLFDPRAKGVIDSP